MERLYENPQKKKQYFEVRTDEFRKCLEQLKKRKNSETRLVLSRNMHFAMKNKMLEDC